MEHWWFRLQTHLKWVLMFLSNLSICRTTVFCNACGTQHVLKDMFSLQISSGDPGLGLMSHTAIPKCGVVSSQVGSAAVSQAAFIFLWRAVGELVCPSGTWRSCTKSLMYWLHPSE